MRTLSALAAIGLFLIAVGCSSAPTLPKDIQGTPEGFFNQYDLTNPAVAEYTYSDIEGNVLAYGLLGRNEDGLFLLESRGAQEDIDFTPLKFINCWVTYNNPQGTIPSGPNAGLPYYLIGQTVDYDVKVLSMINMNIGGYNPPFGYNGPAELTAEMRYAEFDINGKVIPGDLLPGDPIFNWTGIIYPGYQSMNDQFTIVPGTIPGLDVTTVKISAPILLGLFDIIFFDGIAGIWDPVD